MILTVSKSCYTISIWTTGSISVTIHIKSKVITIYDPYNKPKSNYPLYLSIFGRITAYIEDYAYNYSYNILFESSLPWREMNIIKNFELQSIDDSINCGCYCAYYFACNCNLLKHSINSFEPYWIQENNSGILHVKK